MFFFSHRFLFIVKLTNDKYKLRRRKFSYSNAYMYFLCSCFFFCPVSFYYQKLPLSLFFLWQAMWWNFNVFFRFCHDVFWLIHTERHWLYSVNWEKKSLEMLYMRYSYWSVCVCYDTFIIVYCKMPIEFTHVLLINIHLRWCCPRSVCVCVLI